MTAEDWTLILIAALAVIPAYGWRMEGRRADREYKRAEDQADRADFYELRYEARSRQLSEAREAARELQHLPRRGEHGRFVKRSATFGADRPVG